jgi:hypothetical protein
MRKAFVALLLLAGAAVFSANTVAAVDYQSDDVVKGERMASPGFHKELGRAARLGTSAGVSDTVFIGYLPGTAGPNNYWSIGSKKGRTETGACKDCGGQGAVQYAQWSFEAPLVDGDSLQGWTAFRMYYTSTAGQSRADWARPWWAIDIGNNVNTFPGGHKGRTMGVVGAWHRDDSGAPVGATRPDGTPHLFGTESAGGLGQHGNNDAAGGGDGTGADPAWAVIAGSYSAWMGVRAHNDIRFVDGADPDGAGPIQSGALGGTGNPFTDLGAAFSTNGPSIDGDGTDKGLPGYLSQMDQMLYKDIDMSASPGSSLTLTFKYQTQLSTGIGTAVTTRTGWFNHDPLQVTFVSTAGPNLALGNFISSTDAGDDNAPRDSFMVYIGSPTGATFKGSDGANHPTDPLRKWFSETIQSVDGHYLEILSVAGPNSALDTPHNFSLTVPNAGKLAEILANGNNKVRLVFRVKTNRGFDDEGTAFSSQKRGAAQIDDVTYQIGGGAVVGGAWGDFEAAGSINNATNVDPLNAWKSTGKPPWATGHVENLNIGLAYDDLCGAVGSITRVCDLVGNILTFGDHEKPGHPHGSLVDGTADREVLQSAVSPSIQLATPVAGTNPIGLNTADADATEDLYVDMDLAGFTMAPSIKGDYWRYYMANYPASDDYGNATWSGQNPPPYIIFNPDPQCFQDFIDHPIKAWGIMETSNASGLPDSVRITVQLFQRCFRDAAPQCGSTAGAYWDNLDLMMIDGTPQQISVDIWDLFQDTFPSNETPGIAGVKAAFDTTAAVIKVGRANGNDYVTGLRYPTPCDSILIHSSASDVEMYMIFRIMPGAGNYVTNGRPDLDGQFNLRKVPTSATPIVSGELTNFWSNYIANNGAHGSPEGHPGAVARSGIYGAWDPNVWNSARCDTAEVNLFACRQKGVTGGPTQVTDFATTYHERDAKGGADPNGDGNYADHGPLAKQINVCYVATLGGNVNQVTCRTGDPAATYVYPPDWAAFVAGTGYPGTTKTYEFTKIIPDGLLTPGAHVQYFLARYDIGAAAGTPYTAAVPDTMNVFPQNAESSTDAHRWQYVSVLPDAWKEFGHVNPNRSIGTGAGLGCMLVIDNNDRRGNERVWTAVADSIGATAVAKHGAYTGYYAPGSLGVFGDAVDVNDPAYRVSLNGGQPGTTWDLFNVKASESLGTSAGSPGSRLGPRPAGNTQLFGANASEFPGYSSRQGPTPDMLKAYYSIIVWLTGDLNDGVLSPAYQRTANDITLITDFLGSGDTSTPNRGMYLAGDGVVEDAILSDWAGQASLMLTWFGADLLDRSYILATGNSEPAPDLNTAAGVISTSADAFGMRNICLWTNDVLAQAGAPTAIASEYEDTGGGPYISGLRHAHSASEPYISLVDGFDIEHVTSRGDVTSRRRVNYYYNVFNSLFSAVCPTVGTPIGLVDVTSRDFGNYFRLANTPLRNGEARIDLSLAKADRVQVKIFDVSGRLVRTLADRMFEAGEHSLRWDGSDNDGRAVARGVYFTSVEYKGMAFKAAKKLTVLQ